jgi:hypothetical protein
VVTRLEEASTKLTRTVEPLTNYVVLQHISFFTPQPSSAYLLTSALLSFVKRTSTHVCLQSRYLSLFVFSRSLSRNPCHPRTQIHLKYATNSTKSPLACTVHQLAFPDHARTLKAQPHSQVMAFFLGFLSEVCGSESFDVASWLFEEASLAEILDESLFGWKGEALI